MQKVATAGQAIVECLIRNGVDRIFGIPGVHTYHLFDALYAVSYTHLDVYKRQVCTPGMPKILSTPLRMRHSTMA